MKQSEILVAGIEYKVKRLIEQKKLLQQKNENLKSEVESLKQELEEIKNDNKALEEKIQTIKVSSVLLSNKDNKNIHQRIDELVREINKSISILNSFNNK